jgi:enoyl-CoA hydratase
MRTPEVAMPGQFVHLDEVETGIFRLTIDRSDALNALNSAVLQELAAAFAEPALQNSARVLLVTGGGQKAFVAGADIAEMQSFTPAEAARFSQHGHAVFATLEGLPMPTIALVNGYCLGGGNELALSCDWIVASDRAVFGQPEVGLGITPGFGGTQRLPRRIGSAAALELLLSGRRVDAAEAFRLGLASHVCQADELQGQGMEVARKIATLAPLAVRLSKQAVRHGRDLPLRDACFLESQLFALAFATADQSEGMSAFLAKRSPRFAAM